MYHSSHCHSCLSHWLSHHIVLGHIRRENAEQAATMTPEHRPQTSCFSDHRVFVVEQQQQSRGVERIIPQSVPWSSSSSSRGASTYLAVGGMPTVACGAKFIQLHSVASWIQLGGLYVRGALRGVGFTCLIMLCVSTSFARFLSSCRCVGISFCVIKRPVLPQARSHSPRP